MEDADLRQNFSDIKNSLTRQSDTQGKIFEKVDETNKDLEKHIRQSIERKGQMELKISKIEATADGTSKLIGDHLSGHKWKTRWILGIIGGIIATVVAAVLVAFR